MKWSKLNWTNKLQILEFLASLGLASIVTIGLLIESTLMGYVLILLGIIIYCSLSIKLNIITEVSLDSINASMEYIENYKANSVKAVERILTDEEVMKKIFRKVLEEEDKV